MKHIKALLWLAWYLAPVAMGLLVCFVLLLKVWITNDNHGLNIGHDRIENWIALGVVWLILFGGMRKDKP